MKSVLFFVFIIGMNVAYSQKISIFSENISFEVSFLEKGDSVAADIKIVNFAKEKICFPILHNSINALQYELSSIGGTLDIRVGISSRFAGMPLEFNAVLRQINSQECITFKTNYVKRTEAFEAVASFDFVKLDDLLNILSKKSLASNPVVKGSDYVSHVHVARAKVALPTISYR